MSLKKAAVKFIKVYLAGLIISYLLFYFVGFYYQAVGEDKQMKLPEFALRNQFGQPQSFSSYKGKVILMDFWFAGCGPCLEEMRYYPALLEKYPDKLVILSYSTDAPALVDLVIKNHPEPWSFLESNNKNWLFFSDTEKGNSYAEALTIREFPTYFIIDESGNVISTPKSGLFGVERKLGGYFNLGLSFKKFNHSSYIRNHSKSLLIIYTCLATAAAVFFYVISFIVRKLRRVS